MKIDIVFKKKSSILQADIWIEGEKLERMRSIIGLELDNENLMPKYKMNFKYTKKRLYITIFDILENQVCINDFDKELIIKDLYWRN